MTLTSPTSFNLFWTCASSSQLLWFLLASSQLISFILTSCQLFSALLPFFSALPSPAFLNSAQLIPASSQLFSTSSFFPPFSTLFSPSPCHFVLILHREAFTHGCLCTQILLHTETFTQKSFYTQKLLHRKAFNTQKFIQGSFYTKKLLHREVFAHRSLYTELVRRETFTQRSFYKEVSTQKSFYAEKFLHKGQTFCTEKPSRTKRQQKLQLQKGISAPKGKKWKIFHKDFFLRNHQRQNMPKWRKICEITTIDLDAATSIRFTTLSCKRQIYITHSSWQRPNGKNYAQPQQKLKLQNWISKKRMRHFLQGCLKGKFLAPKWRKIAERSPRQPWCSRQYDIRLSADFWRTF